MSVQCPCHVQYETPRPIHWANGEFVDWFNQLIHKYWYLERFQNWSPRGSQTWVRCENLAVSSLPNSLGSKLSLSCSDLMNHRCSEAWCAILSSLNLFYLSASLSYTLSLFFSPHCPSSPEFPVHLHTSFLSHSLHLSILCISLILFSSLLIKEWVLESCFG